jgi:hypothetical protein
MTQQKFSIQFQWQRYQQRDRRTMDEMKREFEKLADYELAWRPNYSGADARRGVQIFRNVEALGPYATVIILTEPPGNPGISVTNGVEQIATALCRKHSIDPHSVTWIEHYDRPKDCRVCSGAGVIESQVAAPGVIVNGAYCDRCKGTGKSEPDSWDAVKFDWDDDRARHPQWESVEWAQVAERIGAAGREWKDL